MSLLDTLIYGYRTILNAGVELTRRNKVNFIGCVVADNPTTGCTDVTPPGVGASVAGADTQVQFNDGGAAFGADAGLTFDKSVTALRIGSGGFFTVTSGNMVIGSDPALTGSLADNVQIYPTTIVYLGASNSTGFAVNGTKAIAYQGVLDLFNAGCATIGHLRAPNATNIASFRSVDTINDVCAVASDASDNLWVGSYVGFANPCVQLNLGGSFGWLLSDAGSTSMYGFSGQIHLGEPVVGYNTPFAMNGYTAIDIADADYTLVAADFSVKAFAVSNATPMTADRAILYPDTTDANAYEKFVRNTNGGGFSVVVYGVAGFAGSTVTIADGFSAMVGFNAAGAYRMGPDVAN
jgi:hypothetical protein